MHEAGRVRAHSKANAKLFEQAAIASAAALAVAVDKAGEQARILVTLGKSGKKDRYNESRIGRKLIGHVLNLAHMADHIEFFKSSPKDRFAASAFRPTPHFLQSMERFGVSAADFEEEEHPVELIRCATSSRIDSQDDDNAAESASGQQRRLIDYIDTAQTVEMRAQVAAVNQWLHNADIDFIDDEQFPRVDAKRRRLWRIFKALTKSPHKPSRRYSRQVTADDFPEGGHGDNDVTVSIPTFGQGGRLYGEAFWLNLARERRRASLRIDGEPIAEVDYSAMFLRLAYQEQRRALVMDDPYDIPGVPRDAAKLAIVAMLQSPRRLKALPKGLRRDGPQGGLLDEAWHESLRGQSAWRVLRQRVLEVHPILSSYEEHDAGAHFQFIESEILMAVLGRLQKAGITGLPLHDGVLVAQSRAGEVQTIMAEESQRVAGFIIPVRIKFAEEAEGQDK